MCAAGDETLRQYQGDSSDQTASMSKHTRPTPYCVCVRVRVIWRDGGLLKEILLPQSQLGEFGFSPGEARRVPAQWHTHQHARPRAQDGV